MIFLQKPVNYCLDIHLCIFPLPETLDFFFFFSRSLCPTYIFMFLIRFILRILTKHMDGMIELWESLLPTSYLSTKFKKKNQRLCRFQ